MSQKQDKTLRPQYLVKAQEKYKQKLYQFSVALNKENLQEEINFLLNLDSKSKWLVEKIHEDMKK